MTGARSKPVRRKKYITTTNAITSHVSKGMNKLKKSVNGSQRRF
jgi:hypothetical protein